MSLFKKQKYPIAEQSEPEEDQIPPDLNTKLSKQPSKTIIGDLTTLKANITGTGNITIVGNFLGSLKVTGDLDISEQADVEGEIEATNILIRGKIQGKVLAFEKIELLKTAQVKADIKTKFISVETGAALDGKCNIENHN